MLEGERAGFMKVRREQEKGLALLRNDDKYNEKIEKSKAQVGKLKEECKTLFAKIGENERQLLRVHERTVGRKERMKEVEEKIKDSKDRLKKGSNIVTIEMIAEIEEEIVKLESEYK